MFENMIHGGGAPVLTESVYYTGTDTLLEGYALCYDFNAADVNQENATQEAGTDDGVIIPDVGEEYFNSARRLLVEKPAEGNKIHFAGIVAKESDGVTGPGWVKIHKPGSICNVYCYSNCDHEGTAPTASGQKIALVVGQYYMMDGPCFPGKGAATVLQDIDRSSTAGLVMAELDNGPLPSGGIVKNVGTLATISGAATLSDVLATYPMYCGVYEIDDTNAASADVILSMDVLSTDGKFIGQKVMFIGGASMVSSAASIELHAIQKAQFSTYAGTVTSAAASLSDTGEYVALEWNGVNWTVLGGHESIPT